MANTVRLKRSAVPGKVPTTANLDLGELALNTADGKVYMKKDDGTESIVEIGASGGESGPVALSKQEIDADYNIPDGYHARSFESVDVLDGVTVEVPDGSIWEVAKTDDMAIIANASGYFFQNSGYFENGATHVGNPDVVEEVLADAETVLKFTSTTAGESGNHLQAQHAGDDATSITHFYDRSTGKIMLHNAAEDEFVLVRLAVDVEPDSDGSEAAIILRCQANGASGAFTFDIEEQFLSLDQGADTEYSGVVSIPVFIGSSLADQGGTATITPIIRLTNSGGDIKPRSLTFFLWS